MSLDEAQQVMESINAGDLTNAQCEDAILSDPRLKTAFDTVAALAVEQFCSPSAAPTRKGIVLRR
jgi:hypothetical protein